MAGNPAKASRSHAKLAPYFLPMLYNALDEEIGLYIRTDQRVNLCNILYTARTLAQDPALEALIILQPTEDVIFIAKKATELDDA